MRDVNHQKQCDKDMRQLFHLALAILLLCLLGLECQAASGAKVVSFMDTTIASN